MTFLAESAHDDEKEDVEGDEVDDEHVAAPRRHLTCNLYLLKGVSARKTKA